MTTELILSEINIYPVKSLGSISLTSAKVEARGLEYDRRWMLVDENGSFLTQRKYPQMALLKCQMKPEGFEIIHLQKKRSFLIPFEINSSKELIVKVWNDTCRAFVLSKDADNWFSNELGVKCSLVYMPDNTYRKVDNTYARNDEIVSFADAFPFMMIGQASLDDLNSKLDKPVPMNRFRPNFVFTGGTPFEEDSFKRFKIGDLVFVAAKPCARCAVSSIDQDTAEQGTEPSRTLASYRTFNKKIMFGQNLLQEGSDGIVRVGDVIKVKLTDN